MAGYSEHIICNNRKCSTNYKNFVTGISFKFQTTRGEKTTIFLWSNFMRHFVNRDSLHTRRKLSALPWGYIYSPYFFLHRSKLFSVNMQDLRLISRCREITVPALTGKNKVVSIQLGTITRYPILWNIILSNERVSGYLISL